jgi:hypothetical protein
MSRIWEGMLISSPSEDADEASAGEFVYCMVSYPIDTRVRKEYEANWCRITSRPRDTHARCAEVSR